MAVPSSALAAARRYGPLVDTVAARYRNPVNGRSLSGAALLLKLSKGESGFDAGAVSSAGARGETQFTPGSRAIVLKRFGVDPWRSTDEAFHAAALHLLGKVNGSKGLEGYNPGDPSYPAYILGQKVGGGSASGSSSAAAKSAPVPSSSLPAPSSSAGIAPLLAALQQQRSQPASVGLQAPAVSARAAMPQGAMLPPSGGGPSAPPDVSALLSAVQAAGSGPASPQTPVYGAQGGSPPATKGTAGVLARAAHIDAQRLPYKWGGGHGADAAKDGAPLDCSGAVSKVLGVDPRVSGQFKTIGRPGDGGNQGVTIYANDTHVLMKINGHFFGTSQSNPGGGAGWIPHQRISSGYLSRFTARHL